MTACVGIDVAKYTLEWSLGSEGKIQPTRNEPRAIAQLVRRLVALDPRRVVVESTGGYERALILKLAEAALPVSATRSTGEGPRGAGAKRWQKGGVVAVGGGVDGIVVSNHGGLDRRVHRDVLRPNPAPSRRRADSNFKRISRSEKLPL